MDRNKRPKTSHQGARQGHINVIARPVPYHVQLKLEDLDRKMKNFDIKSAEGKERIHKFKADGNRVQRQDERGAIRVEEEQERDDRAGGRIEEEEQKEDYQESDFVEQEERGIRYVNENKSQVVHDNPVEYNDFEQLSGTFEIKVEGKIQRKIKVNARSKKKEPSKTEPEIPADPYTFNVIIYRGILQENNLPDDEHHFVVFSESEGLYIRVEELKARLERSYEERKDIYMKDWAMDAKFEKPFTLWNSRGAFKNIGIPTRAFGDYTQTEDTRADWQYEYWTNIAKRAESAKQPKYNVVARYWDLKPTNKATTKVARANIKLRFEASDVVTKDVLEKLLPIALSQCCCQPDCTAVEKGEGDKASNDLKIPWVRIGKHLFGLYELYASPETVELLRKEFQQQDHRPIPSIGQAAAADQKLFGDLELEERPHAETTGTSLTQHKLTTVAGAKRVKGQVAVMKNVSATEFAKIFDWPKNKGDGTWKNQAEWLHRSAFSFGGLNETASKMSSQTINNLIFGTKEANTFMMRYESTIKHVTELEYARLKALKPESKTAARPDKITSTMSTRIVYDHREEGEEPFSHTLVDKTFKLDEQTASRLDQIKALLNIQAEPETTVKEAEAKADEMEMQVDMKAEDPKAETNYEKAAKQLEPYSWFAPRLEYVVRTELSQLNQKKNFKPTIEPFSRAIPLRLEAELDQLLEEHVFGVGGTPATRHSENMANVGRYAQGTVDEGGPLSKLLFTPGSKRKDYLE